MLGLMWTSQVWLRIGIYHLCHSRTLQGATCNDYTNGSFLICSVYFIRAIACHSHSHRHGINNRDTFWKHEILMLATVNGV
jgi:hypothetical protein